MEFNDIKTLLNIFLLFLFILLRKFFYFLLSPYFLTYYVIYYALGPDGREVSYRICGYLASASDIVNVCIDANGVCTASVRPKKDDCLDFYMFDSVRTYVPSVNIDVKTSKFLLLICLYYSFVF